MFIDLCPLNAVVQLKVGIKLLRLDPVYIIKRGVFLISKPNKTKKTEQDFNFLISNQIKKGRISNKTIRC